MIDATSANIEWLLDRLKKATRELASIKTSHPIFVLLTKDRPDRERVENEIFQYFAVKYGNLLVKKIDMDASACDVSRFNFPELHASIILMDIGTPPPKIVAPAAERAKK